MNAGTVEMSTYDGKGKDNGKLTYTISNVSKTGSAVTAKFESEMTDKRGKSLSKSSGVYKCDGGTLFVDASVVISPEQMTAYKDMDVKAEQAFIEYPSTFKEDQALKDAHFKMTIRKNGELFATITYDATNRVVKGKETITTAAGTWECWRISSDTKVRQEISGIGIPITFRTNEWFAPGFGVVKTESSKGARTMGSTVITAVKK